MRNVLKILPFLILALGTKEVTAQEHELTFNRTFTHVVFFWLENPHSAEDRAKFLASLRKFMNNSKYAETKFIGKPANTPRDVVDNSYTYSLIVTFPSQEIQDYYQKESAHLNFIKEVSHLWNRVQVYDSVGLID